MDNMDSASIFSYVCNRQPGLNGIDNVFLREVRKSYLRRAGLLALFIPFDLFIYLIFFTLNLFRKETSKIVFLTSLYPSFISRSSATSCCFVGAPNVLWLAVRNRGIYVPASIVYLLLSLIRWDSVRPEGFSVNFAIGLMAGLLRPFVDKDSSMVFHSDALPFARCVLLAGRKLGLRTCCIQHGIFHRASMINEVDGYLCELNVVRSTLDGELIRQANPTTAIVVEPDFFLRCDAPRQFSRKSGKKMVIVLGEGAEQTAPVLSNDYMLRIEQLALDLQIAGFHVVFRPHPLERGILKRFRFENIDTGSLDSCIANASVIVGYSSTVLFEAASLGVLACQIDVCGEHFPSMSRDGVMIEQVGCVADIVAALNLRRSQPCFDSQERKRAAVDRIFQLLCPH